MTQERIENAIKIIKHAIDNGISVGKAAKTYDFSKTYVKNTKAAVIKNYKNGNLNKKYYERFMSNYNLYYESISFTNSNLNINENDWKNGDLIDEKNNLEKGEKTVTKYFFSVPPTDEDIKKEFQIDNINTQLSHYWVKAKTKGYFVSVNIKIINNNFYSEKELKLKLKSLLPDYSSVKLSKTNINNSEKALIILVSDDHAGAINEPSIYDRENYDGSVYTKRLINLVNEAKKLGKFEICYVISAGDQLNSWSNKTTRGGHEVKSLSNKDQFDVYVKGRKLFYDELFNSKISNYYHVIDMENSNHSGLGVSYMANSALGYYIEGKYPNVKRKSIHLPIDYIKYGKHILGIAHGKDDTFMKSPMPMNLDKKTDLYLFEYFNYKDISPKEKYITLYKGDLHSFNIQYGKFGRYMNLPSIMGGSSYIELNFGNSKPGAILEIIEKNSPNIITKPIWF